MMATIIEGKKMLDEIMSTGEGLTDWELNFIDDMTVHYGKGFAFSSKQLAVLKRIQDDRCRLRSWKKNA